MKYRVLLLLGLASLGCAARKAGRGGAEPVRAEPSRCECPCAEAKAVAAAAPSVILDHNAAAVPVTLQDPTWGNADAPVTVVEFSDFQCPFCVRVLPTLEELKRAYGPEKLRLVWKNFPLPFHVNARSAAEAAMTAFAMGGSTAFWKYHDLLFANQRGLDPDRFASWAGQAGLASAEFDDAFSAGRGRTKVDQDAALAARLRIRGTPSFLINGVPLAGALPTEKFKAIIDVQLAAAKALRAQGVPAEAIYPTLCSKNLAPGPDEPPEDGDAEDATIWSVPVERQDPVRGLADALVTLVVFSDFQCPFCAQLASTLDLLRGKYGRELRVVWKDRPLPFHEQAMAAAVLARVALDRKGADGFWQAHDAIFSSQPELGRRALEKIAKQIGIPFAEVEKSLAAGRYRTSFRTSEDLADRLGAQGTPTSFVNGYRVVGAVPLEKLVAVVDAQLSRAQAMLAAGQPRAGLYQAIATAGKGTSGTQPNPGDTPSGDSRAGAK